MNNNNLQKRYFSPKRVFLYSVVALVHVLYAQALDGSTAMTGMKEYGSSKNSVGRMKDDAFLDSVLAKFNAKENDEPEKSEYEDPFGLSTDSFEDIDDEVASSAGEHPIFRDVISERSGHRGSRIPTKGGFDTDKDVDMTSENDTEKDSGSKDEPPKFWPTFEIDHEIKDPFNKHRGVFDEEKRYEIPGLAMSDARITKFSAIFYILTLSVFLFVKLEAFI